jgi:hypothetical protein
MTARRHAATVLLACHAVLLTCRVAHGGGDDAPARFARLRPRKTTS